MYACTLKHTHILFHSLTHTSTLINTVNTETNELQKKPLSDSDETESQWINAKVYTKTQL